VEIDESTCNIAQKKYEVAAQRCNLVLKQSDQFVLKSKSIKCSALLVLAEAKLHLGNLSESAALFNQAGDLVMKNALSENPIAKAEALSSLGCFYLGLGMRPKSIGDISRQEARDRANSFLSRAETSWLQISQSIKYRIDEQSNQANVDEKRLPSDITKTTYEASIFNLAAMQNNLGVLALSQNQKALEFLKDAESSINGINGYSDLKAKILYNQSDC
jgi:tetratricopeptide (TPR) repeat protein